MQGRAAVPVHHEQRMVVLLPGTLLLVELLMQLPGAFAKPLPHWEALYQRRMKTFVKA